MAAETPNDTTMESKDMMVSMPVNSVISLANTTPRTIPMNPPGNTDQGCFGQELGDISRCVAPVARLTPISRMRSITDASIMFIMPIPPTMSEILAITPNTILKMSFVRCSCLSNSSGTVISISAIPE